MVERVRLPDSGIAIEGAFELPQLARLSAEDQVFVAAFLRSHGSIKEMEQVFGVSYPTVKARLNRIAVGSNSSISIPNRRAPEVIERLKRGEITADEASKPWRAKMMKLYRPTSALLSISSPPGHRMCVLRRNAFARGCR